MYEKHLSTYRYLFKLYIIIIENPFLDDYTKWGMGPCDCKAHDTFNDGCLVLGLHI